MNHPDTMKRAENGHREIVFDTETTGFDARGDDRITEIGCIEIIDFLPTGRSFHAYCNPQREVPEKVVEITGLTTEFLRDKPLFKSVAQDFIDFLGDSPLIAHNADFDKGFINAELDRAGFPMLPDKRFIDTLRMARAQFPGSPATLDALCKRFDISLSARDKHGAIIDSELLAAVYLELNGGRERRFGFKDARATVDSVVVPIARPRPTPLAPLSSQDERASHAAFIKSLGDDMVWETRYWSKSRG
ncbi:DNA polymerase III subunit epsilon [Fretibacter rubidus]|uniref:DNA polymerase III subunit epsilon n=1 Tax=Fretibacter rubidus TaxID=570162 RepID=UPI00352A5AD7